MKTKFVHLLILVCIFLSKTVFAQELYSNHFEIELSKRNTRQLILLTSGNNNVRIKNLQVNEQYIINFNKDDLGYACQPNYHLINGDEIIQLVDTKIQFIAQSEEVLLIINRNCIANYSTRLALHISIAKMNDFWGKDIERSFIGISFDYSKDNLNVMKSIYELS